MDIRRGTLAAVLFFGLSKAQQTAFFSDKDGYRLNLAENLYDAKVLPAAQYEFGRQYFYNVSLSETRKEAANFYYNVIGVILHQNHAEEGLENFIKEYPNSIYFGRAGMPLADYYLEKKEFEKALQTLQKVNQYQLSREENTQYILKLGYAKFMLGDAAGATEALEEAYKTAPTTEKNDIAYMLGHLNYSAGNTDKAFGYFDAVKSDPKFEKLVRPYYVQMYYNSKDYDRAIQEGQSLLTDDVSDSYKNEVRKIIGESYFMKGDNVAAYPYLQEYISAQQNPSESDLYEMGFVSAKLGKYEEAVSYYNRLISSNTAVAQNAYYQLGNAYLQTNRKKEALSAFRSASQMNYDAKVQQLAYAQYAKLSYEIGNPFEAAPKVIQAFLAKYPNAPQSSELRPLLVKSYLYSGNYRETLAAIDRLPNSSQEIDKVDQEVSFLLGSEEFNKSNLDDAEKYFLRSLQLSQNHDISNRALYWLAQTYYKKGNYPSAIARYEKLLNENFEERPQLNYDLAYAYFKSKKFDDAQRNFLEYLKNPSPEFKNDAELRLADTFYAQNKLNDAIAIYEKADAGDYALYQKSLSLGYKGDTEAKISNLKNLLSKFPDSEYADDANYEIGTAYAAQDNFGASDDYFNRVIQKSANRDLVANAEIYKVQNEVSQNQNDRALADLAVLGSKYRGTMFAQKIVALSKSVYQKNGDTAGYQNFAKSLGVTVGSDEVGEFSLNAAKNYFAKKEYQSAIPLYEKYLAQNPSSDGASQTKYELAESYFQTKKTDKALPIFQELATAQNDYQEDAAVRLAQIYLSEKNTADAKNILIKLSDSSSATVKNFANTELMKIFADEKDFSNAEKAADVVLSNTKNSATVIESAKVIKARALMNAGKDKNAQAAYAALEKSSNTAVAAEALYAKAFYQNKAKAFKTSNETIFKLANNYSSEQFWGARALVLMAKNYIGLKDRYQASYTLDQILANYQEFTDVVAEAREVKKSMK